MRLQPDSPTALLVLTLLDRYHREVAPALKRLRLLATQQPTRGLDQWSGLSWTPGIGWQRTNPLVAGVPWDTDIDRNRVAATGWFNQVCVLYQSGLIPDAVLGLVAAPKGAALWVEHVAPLDREVRLAAHPQGQEASVRSGVPFVELFWQKYAEGKTLTRVVRTTSRPDEGQVQ